MLLNHALKANRVRAAGAKYIGYRKSTAPRVVFTLERFEANYCTQYYMSHSLMHVQLRLSFLAVTKLSSCYTLFSISHQGAEMVTLRGGAIPLPPAPEHPVA